MSESRWLVTGCAGFIGSHLTERLLSSGASVTGVDNFSTGFSENLEDLQSRISPQQWSKFDFFEGDICDAKFCASLFKDTSFDSICHLAALGSVPRSIQEPLKSLETNLIGFAKLLEGARKSRHNNIVYASSSSVYGDIKDSPKIESRTGQPLSPYAASKQMDEALAASYNKAFGFAVAGLRFFNVFGPRQNPQGAYAAVIPRWIDRFIDQKEVIIFGDGKTSRDFSYVDNVVDGILQAAKYLNANPKACDVFNFGCGRETTLLELYDLIRQELINGGVTISQQKPLFGPTRPGDVKHSLADISLAKDKIGFAPKVSVSEGISHTVKYFTESENNSLSCS